MIRLKFARPRFDLLQGVYFSHPVQISDIRTAMATKSGSLGAQLPPADELESIIKTRFLTTAAVPKGEQPFKRLIKR